MKPLNGGDTQLKSANTSNIGTPSFKSAKDQPLQFFPGSTRSQSTVGGSHKFQMQQRIEKELEELAQLQEASISIKKNVDQTRLEF